MPEMDGYSLCESIKNNPQYCHIPVILLTAKTTTDDKIKGLQYGSDAYIEKPFSVQHLKTQIDNLLQNRQKLRKLFASSPLVTAETMAISPKDKEFIERLDAEIQKNLQEPTFSIDTLAEIMFLSENQRDLRYVAQRLPEDNPFEDGCRIAFTTGIPDQRNLRIGRVQFFFLFHEMF